MSNTPENDLPEIRSAVDSVTEKLDQAVERAQKRAQLNAAANANSATASVADLASQPEAQTAVFADAAPTVNYASADAAPKAQIPAFVNPDSYVSNSDYVPGVPYPPTGSVPTGYDQPGYSQGHPADPGVGYFPVSGALYLPTPPPPLPRSNRGLGALVAVLGLIVFAGIYYAVHYFAHLKDQFGFTSASVVDFLLQPIFWLPCLVFFLGYLLLITLINRGAPWVHTLSALSLAVLVYLVCILAELWLNAHQVAPGAIWLFICGQLLNPYAIGAGVIAREIPIWFGFWLGVRGRRLKEHNRVDQEEYQRALAAHAAHAAL